MPTAAVRDLGICLDADISMTAHYKDRICLFRRATSAPKASPISFTFCPSVS